MERGVQGILERGKIVLWQIIKKSNLLKLYKNYHYLYNF